MIVSIYLSASWSLAWLVKFEFTWPGISWELIWLLGRSGLMPAPDWLSHQPENIQQHT